MARKKSGQAAFEYLITYGWAFIGIVTILGVLIYFGFFNFGKYVREECFFGQGIGNCNAFVASKTNNTIRMIINNGVGTDLNITDCKVKMQGTNCSTCQYINPWPSYSNMPLNFTNCSRLADFSRLDGEITLTFSFIGNTNTHPLKGHFIIFPSG